MICAVGNELLPARSPAAFQRHIERVDLQGAKVIDIVDATGEGWAFHADLMIVSPLTLKKRWKKVEVIRLALLAPAAERPIRSPHPPPSEPSPSGRLFSAHW